MCYLDLFQSKFSSESLALPGDTNKYCSEDSELRLRLRSRSRHVSVGPSLCRCLCHCI